MFAKRTLLSLAALVLALLLAAVPAGAQSPVSPASDLRAALTSLLSEHVYLAGNATGAALDGREADFDAAAAALDENSVELSQAIGSVYGAEAEQAFLPLWRAHIGFFVDYTQGVAAKDQAKQDKAVEDLTGYVNDFAAFISSANPNLPKEAVASLLSEHVVELKAVVDAQASGDTSAAYSAMRKAFAHSGMIAEALAGGIATQFPDKYSGEVNSAASGLQSGLRMLLQEHVALASNATGAALDGRSAEFETAAAALDENSVELSQAIGSVYGAEAEQAFLPLWRAHIGFFVDYTQGVAAKDQAKQDKAVEDLTGYVNDFAAFISSANPNLPKQAVADLVTEHVLSLKAVVDAQASGDASAAYSSIREAYSHMSMIADPLAGAIVKQFPAEFGSEAATAQTTGDSQQPAATTGGSQQPAASGDHQMPATMPNTAGEELPWALYLAVAGIVLALGAALVARTRRVA